MVPRCEWLYVDAIAIKKAKRMAVNAVRPISNLTVSYVAASDAVEITLGSAETFPTGGQITVLGGLTTAAGGTLNRARRSSPSPRAGRASGRREFGIAFPGSYAE